MHTKSKLWLFMFCAGLITMATFSGTTEASEFLADVVMKGGMMSGDGKVWVKGQKMRQEMGTGVSETNLIAGSPGAAGQVEASVRRLDRPEDGDQLRAGEVLVTKQTDIAWTLLFPRAAAVVTDVGAPLSHAAIVARELGIPAVVGCGDATMRLKTGDRVRVDGGRGTVEILREA